MPPDTDSTFRTLVLGVDPFGRRSLPAVRKEKLRRPQELADVSILDATRETDRTIGKALDIADALVVVADLSRPTAANAAVHALRHRPYRTPSFVITLPGEPRILADLGTTTTVVAQVPDTDTAGEVALAPVFAVNVFGLIGFHTDMLWELYPQGRTYVGWGAYSYSPQRVGGGLFARGAFKAMGLSPMCRTPEAKVFMTFGLGDERGLADVQELLDESYAHSREDADWVVAGGIVPWEKDAISVRLMVCPGR